MPKSKSYGGLIFLLVVLAAGGGGGWYYFNKGSDKKPEFQTVKVGRGDITQVVTATGDLQPVVVVDIGAQVSGQIKEVRVDFNSVVKAGDILALIDEATPTQRLRQAEADLESAKANNRLLSLNVERTRELFGKKLVSQQELDNAEAQLAQSNATLLTRNASVENAKLDLSRCTITAPIDGMVIDRKTDKGRTVNANMNAPVLFTLVNDLTKMQINAAVAEADVGSISAGQEVKFTVDAFPNRTFAGTVRMVRNAASSNQSVVSYATIIDVNNDDMKLKPGMTANVSIIVTQRPGVMRVANGALRVRIPQELMPKAPEAAAKGGKADAKGGATAMTDDASPGCFRNHACRRLRARFTRHGRTDREGQESREGKGHGSRLGGGLAGDARRPQTRRGRRRRPRRWRRQPRLWRWRSRRRSGRRPRLQQYDRFPHPLQDAQSRRGGEEARARSGPSRHLRRFLHRGARRSQRR